MKKRKVELDRPVVRRRELFAYEVISQQRSPEADRTFDDYILGCAIYIAKQVVKILIDSIDEAKCVCNLPNNRACVLKFSLQEKRDENGGPIITWKAIGCSSIKDEINIAEVYGYCFSGSLVYFYDEWVEYLIDSFNSLLGYSSTEFYEDIDKHEWYIKLH